MNTTLLADIGNTRVKLALGRGGKLVQLHSLNWRDEAFVEDLGAFCSEIPTPDSAWISCVANKDLLKIVKEQLRERWAVPLHLARVSATACGISNAYPEPAQLGVDRWLGAIAAWQRCHNAVCVIDCGTAMTVNLISEDGVFLGGTISAGFGLMQEALAGRTADLFVPEQTRYEWPATDTSTAIYTGCLDAAAGLAERALRRLRERFHAQATGLVTGGDAALLLPLLGDGFELAPSLVLEGLLACAGEPS